MPQISIILPCLNMANYIKECLDSIIFHSLFSIEILVIDAGSTDGTLDILQSYTDRDSRIKIIHSKKKSYGYQVNLGVALATGEYIGIVDADDRIDPEMYEILYYIAIETEADYVKGTARMFYRIADKEDYSLPILQFPEKEYGQKGIIEICPNQMPQLLTMDNFLWGGIYRRDFIKKFKLHESPGAAFQDLGGLLQTQMNARKGIYISKCVYEYRQDNVNASINNKKGFHFVKDEYGWAEQFLDGQSLSWQVSFYRKQFLHFMDRVYAMAATGSFWKDSMPDILTIADRLACANSSGILTEKELSEEQWKDLLLLWEAPYSLYEKYRRSYEKSRDALQHVIQFSYGKRQTVIFGNGRLGRFIHAQLLYRGYKSVVIYCDNDKEVWGKMQYGVKVVSPEQAVRRFPNAKYIIANRKNTLDMCRQLENLGIEREKMIMFSSEANIRLFGEKEI